MKGFSASSLIALGMAIATSANAQEVKQPEASTQADSSQGLGEDIVVTAQRREESLQRAAVAVSAVSGDTLVARGVADVSALGQFAPALVVQPGIGANQSLYVRGVGGVQGNAFAENPVAFNFNDVYLARPGAVFGAFYDISRVEILKGPQGTLYGRNATGGAINVIPRRPELGTFGGDLTIEYGNYDKFQGSASLNLPVGESVAFRVAGQLVDRDGYLSDGYDDQKMESVRASMLAKMGPDWSVLLVGDYLHQGGKGAGSVLLPGSTFPAPFYAYSAPAISARIGASDPASVAALTTFSNTIAAFAPPFCVGGFIPSGCVNTPVANGYQDNKYYGVTAKLEGDLGFAKLTLLPAYRESKIKYLTPVSGFNAYADETSKQTSLEVRLASNGSSPLGYVLGAYYFHESQDALNFFDQGSLSTLLFAPELKTDSYAAFGQFTYALTDQFRLVLGGRYTHEKRSQVSPLLSGNFFAPINPTPPNFGNPVFGPPSTGQLTFNKFTWKAGIEWDAGPDSLVYANVATGFKSGGFFVAQAPDNVFRPENLTAYTIGTKNRFFDNRLQLNLEAFYWDYSDQQLTFVGPVQGADGFFVNGGKTINAGAARMYGVDAEVRLAVGEGGLLSADVQYLNGKFDSLKYTAISQSGAPLRSACVLSNVRKANPTNPNPADTATLTDVDCSGRGTIASPEWIISLGYRHRFALGGDFGLVMGANTRIESSRETNLDYLPEMHADAYMMSDAFITLEGPGKRWSITGFVNNIEDETVIAGTAKRAIIDTVYGSLRPPRTYGVRATVNF